jgi:hypothetical protein
MIGEDFGRMRRARLDDLKGRIAFQARDDAAALPVRRRSPGKIVAQAA